MPARSQDRRERGGRLLVGAVGLSAAGDFVALIPLAAAVSASSGSGLAVSAIFIALWGPLVALAPLAARVADGLETTRVLSASSLVQAALAMALIPASGSLGPTIGLVALLGSANAFAQAAEFAMVPAVAGSRAQVRRLNGGVETARYIGMTVGPLVGAALAATGGLGLALALDAASFVAIACVALALPVRRGGTDGPVHAGEAALPGPSSLFGDPVLRPVMIVTFLTLLVMTGVATAEVFFAREDLGGGDIGYGLLMTTWTLGMALGAMVVSRRVPSRLLAPVVLAMIALQGLGLALPAAWLSIPFAVAMYLLGGTAHGTKNVLVRSLIHERVRASAHGAAGAAYNALRNGAELIALAGGGLLVEAVGSRSTMALCGGVPLLIAAVALIALHPRLVAGGALRQPRADPIAGGRLSPVEAD